MTRLGDVCVISAGQGAPQGDNNYCDCEQGIPFIKAGDLSNLLSGKPENELQCVNDEVAKNHKLKLYPSGSILFAKSGMSCMKEYVYRTQHPCYVVSHLAIVIPEKVDGEYLRFYFQYHKPNFLIKDSAYPSISLQDISNIELQLPSKEEQEAVATNLNKISELVLLRKHQLLKLDELVKSRFIEMFGDPIDNNKGLPVKKLKEITTLITNGNTPKGGSENYVKSGILFLRSQNVWRNRIELDDVAYIDEATHRSLKKSSLKHKDILITKTGRINTENSSLGRAALYLGENNSANINGHVYLVRLDGSVVPEYAVAILTSEAYRKYIRKVCVGGIDKRQINLDQVEDFPIILPDYDKQIEFVSFVKQVDKSKYHGEITYGLEVAA